MIAETPALGDSSALPMWMQKKKGGGGAGETHDLLLLFRFPSSKRFIERKETPNRGGRGGNDPRCC